MTRAVKAPEGTYAALQATVEGGSQRGDVWVAVTPTQVRRPWRATARTVFQFALALATLLPFIAAGIYRDADQAPAVITQLLAAVATFARVMALPQVEEFLQDWFPWLSAAPPQTPKHLRDDRGVSTVELCLIILTGLAVFAFILWLFPHPNVR